MTLPEKENGAVLKLHDARQVDATDKSSVNDETDSEVQNDPVNLPPSMSDDVLADRSEIHEMS